MGEDNKAEKETMEKTWKAEVLRDLGEAQDVLVSVVAGINGKVESLVAKHQRAQPFGRECLDHIDSALVDECVWRLAAASAGASNDKPEEAKTMCRLIQHIHFDASARGRNDNARFHVLNQHGACVVAQVLASDGTWKSLPSRAHVAQLLVEQAFSLAQLHFFGRYGFDDDDGSSMMPAEMLRHARTYFGRDAQSLIMTFSDAMLHEVFRALDSRHHQNHWSK